MNHDKYLRINKACLVDLQCHWCMPTEKMDYDKLFTHYAVAIDYSLKQKEGDHQQFSMIIEVDVNPAQSLPGYSIAVKGVLNFVIADSTPLYEVTREKLMNYVAIEKSVEYMRQQISEITERFPFGRYELKAIDMQQLFDEKQARVKKIEKNINS